MLPHRGRKELRYMKTTLTQEFLRMPAANLGNAATLPPIYKEKNFQTSKAT